MAKKLLPQLLDEIAKLQFPRDESIRHDVHVAVDTIIYFQEYDIDLLDKKTQRRIAENLKRLYKRFYLYQSDVRIEVRIWPRRKKT